MTSKEATELKVGDHVFWDGDQDDTGTVTKTGRNYLGNYLEIDWKNFDTGALHPNDCENISREEN